jgi:nicotinate-nucleotide adenylyltransferase
LRLAIFGGTFDPIHNAHLAMARVAASRFSLDRVLFVPAARPPHKRGATHASYEDRARMIELAIADEPRFQLSRLEEFTERSYSIDTIAKVRAGMGPDDELFFLIGADAFADLSTWHRWSDVAQSVHFLVISRPGAIYEAPEGVVCDRIDDVAMPESSSEIRRVLASGGRPGGLPESVLGYAAEHGLYRREELGVRS